MVIRLEDYATEGEVLEKLPACSSTDQTIAEPPDDRAY